MTEPINQLAAAPAQGETQRQRERSQTWFQAFASAWGNSMDQKADDMIATANGIKDGVADKPSDIAQLTAQSLQFSYLSQAQNTSMSSVGKALETMARKQ